MGAQGLMAVGVPPQPLWLLYIKIAILVLSLIVLALGAYSESLLWGGGGPGGMDIFIALWSFIVYGGGAALEIWAPQFYYRIGMLVGQILAIIFWLTAWAWSASVASVWLSYRYKTFGGSLAGCAGLGAIAWVLTIVHLIFFIRASILESNPASQAELGKVEVPAQQPYPAQQPGYPAQAPQPYPAQQYPVQQQGPYPPQ
ncbi:hypothetical protein C8A05DRAFT_39751 [Staphylotrichum tortipilum]|uniref:MARVEL domain-containing protein n=1 Tax=Staphylotrichum tortipilum TaxID=2831512 RepID=A0AAN6M8V3_9PEZI|nr:hypothetical protein C8A05DRAFT_39751 [Staphylotrichum longicolle]